MKKAIFTPSLVAMALGLASLTLLPGLGRAGGGAAELKAGGVAVSIDGKSTLHGWHADAGSATVTAEVEDGGLGLAGAVAHGGLKGLQLALAVDSLRSTESSGMDKNMRHDLGSDQYPEIRFTLKSYRLSGLTVTAQGDLAIHGAVRPVTLTAGLTREGDALLVDGSTGLLMSDYGVTPPVMMFGTIRVADQVRISYRFRLSE